MLKNRLFRILVGSGVTVLGYLMLIQLICLVPSKTVVENNQGMQTVFVKLAEKLVVGGNFVAKTADLDRIDILFKNPNLASRDELAVRVMGNNDRVIAEKKLTGFNLGDTTQARVDVPMGLVTDGEMIKVEVVLTKEIDGILEIGTRDSQINIRQFYRNGSDLIGTNFRDNLARLWSNKIVILLPFMVLVALLW
jgi:hypothetical protein